MFEISFANRVAAHIPNLRRNLRIAHLQYTPTAYVSKLIKTSLMYSFLFTVLFFFIIKKAGLPIALLLPIFASLLVAIFLFLLVSIRSRIRKREREIDREVLFVGRYLLVKIYSGRPLLNALIETSESRGVAAKYIKEIVEDIGTGSTIEEALDNAITYSPSEKLQKVLFHINNALQLWIDVTHPLESVLQEITKEEELEIKKYGKKLNTLVIFYMLAAVIAPSLGVAIFIVVATFINIQIEFSGLMVIAFLIVILEFIFITLFRSVRPTVNL